MKCLYPIESLLGRLITDSYPSACMLLIDLASLSLAVDDRAIQSSLAQTSYYSCSSCTAGQNHSTTSNTTIDTTCNTCRSH